MSPADDDAWFREGWRRSAREYHEEVRAKKGAASGGNGTNAKPVLLVDPGEPPGRSREATGYSRQLGLALRLRSPGSSHYAAGRRVASCDDSNKSQCRAPGTSILSARKGRQERHPA